MYLQDLSLNFIEKEQSKERKKRCVGKEKKIRN